MQRSTNLMILSTLALFITSCAQVERNKEGTGEIKTDKMIINKEKVSEGTYLYSFSNRKGMSVQVTNYGGIITSILVPDKNGKVEDIVLGFDSVNSYRGTHPYFGAIVGRYANRISKGIFEIDGQQYQLTINNGDNHLHGGSNGLDRALWSSSMITEDSVVGVKLMYSSPAGDQGYPGQLDVEVHYLLNDDNELMIEYRAVTSAPTPVNLSNHSYFNLAGDAKSDILGHLVQIHADRYTVVDEELIPTGELRLVEGTPFDFREPRNIGDRIKETAGGYDHNFVLEPGEGIRKIAEVSEPESGRIMEIFTNEPGLQFYSGNFLDGSLNGKKNYPYQKHDGFCMETQHFPDSPNHAGFPETILRPGEVYTQTTIYRFSIVK